MEKKFVLPGELVATEEEIMGIDGGYEKDGNFYSLYAGWLNINPETRFAKIEIATKFPVNVRPHTAVYGQIKSLTPQVAILDVWGDRNKTRPVIQSSTAILPIASITTDYLKNLRDAYRVGDIIKAEVEAIEYGTLKLTTKRSYLGVVKAYCSNCRTPLQRDGARNKCPSCGHVEERKRVGDRMPSSRPSFGSFGGRGRPPFRQNNFKQRRPFNGPRDQNQRGRSWK
ncbi:MAG: exosome complex RNA-binding protein Csl4 [Candidatus Diapherotrites archaeon]|nr:exosome complex RNA-binding protein Csl4 [Candidatus Diapherotrites archaeon]